MEAAAADLSVRVRNGAGAGAGRGSQRWEGRQRQGWSPPLGLLGSNPGGPHRPASREELCDLNAAAGLDAFFLSLASMPPCCIAPAPAHSLHLGFPNAQALPIRPFTIGNCSPSPRRCGRPTSSSGLPPITRSASTNKAAGGAAVAATTTVSPYALAKSPSVSAAEADGDDIVRVYGSDRCPVIWRVRVSLL
ncbi:hypothetical protein E2562_003470 [Oryza meyeriana var. granulata]|uniref:Uncharacterized protein n=1 Tax=Oryza meyeriana var. granulata TaxID=110450 RepID=A0A6G1CP98_9ORYZ|nr:hypothetical protein E2562_003470 [Oryza meyeriana var. granulata]